jgi:DNA-directed RNA polymerase beta' subunit
MGKRCDFTARSVITCDPNLRLDELGVPEEIAKRMTIPEVVTFRNMNKLRILVENGADTHPGAKFIKRTDGRLIDLSMLKNRTD